MSDLLQDLCYAARQLARTPGFSAAAIATLALGIGVNTIFFAAVNAMVFRPVRAARVDGLFVVELTDKLKRSRGPLTEAQFRRVEAEIPSSVARIGGIAYLNQPVVVTTPGRGERVEAEVVSSGYEATLDLQPQAGRMLAREDDVPGAQAAVVISDRLWREWFDGNREPIGRAMLRINTVSFLIVGVAPRGYRGRAGLTFRSADVWFTAAAPPALDISTRPVRSRYWSTFVRPVGTRAEAEAAIQGILTSGPDAPGRDSMGVRLYAADSQLGSTSLTRTGITIVGLAGLLLVAACANLANMLFARGAQRAGEVAVRLSLGAGRWRIFRLFLLESVLIASVAAICGLMLALVSTSFLAAAFPSFRDRNFRLFVDLTPDYRVFAFALAAGAAAALAVGVASAWHASAVPPLRALASSGVATGMTQRGRWVRLGLVAVQVSAAVLLLMASAIYVRAAATALDRYVIFDTTPLATGLVNLQLHGYHEARARAFFDRFLNDVRQVPGVESAALADGFPGGTYAATRNVDVLTPREVPGESGEIRELSGTVNRLRAGYAGVSPQFLDTIGLPLRRGRDVQPSDQDSTPLVAIVSESVARLLWPGQDPLGKRLMFGNDGHWRTVVGVSADPVAARVESPLVSPANLVLIPAAQAYRPEMLIVIRSRTPPAHLEPLRAAARAIDDNVALFDLAPAEDSILAWAAPLQAATALTALLGVLALTIATLGVYGVISYVVSLRTREFGIRAALGARPSQVIKLVLDEAIHLMLVGLLAGVLIASLTERYAQSQRFGFLPNEVWTWVLVPTLILIIGLAAAYGPAWRASRIDPNVALREL